MPHERTQMTMRMTMELMIAKDYWTDEDMTSVQAAIDE
jgi:hypothetical protein